MLTRICSGIIGFVPISCVRESTKEGLPAIKALLRFTYIGTLQCRIVHAGSASAPHPSRFYGVDTDANLSFQCRIAL